MNSTETQAIRDAETILRSNLGTLEETRRRIVRWEKSTHEIDAAIADTQEGIGALSSQPAAPVDVVEREPVAWMYTDPDGQRRARIHRAKHYRGTETALGPIAAIPDPDVRAVALEEAADVMREDLVEQAKRLNVLPLPPESPGHWRDRVRIAAIRALSNHPAGEVGDHG